MHQGEEHGIRFFEPRPADKLCAAHFEENMFERNFLADFVAAGLMSSKKKPAKKLVPGAMPTLFEHNRLARLQSSSMKDDGHFI